LNAGSRSVALVSKVSFGSRSFLLFCAKYLLANDAEKHGGTIGQAACASATICLRKGGIKFGGPLISPSTSPSPI
jgi:hypothetical protein